MSIYDRYEKFADKTFKDAADKYVADFTGKSRKRLEYALHHTLSHIGHLPLIAVPWVERAVDPKRLVARLCSLMHLECGGLMNPERRPHGRLVWTLMMGGACFMDLSVIPPVPTGDSNE